MTCLRAAVAIAALLIVSLASPAQEMPLAPSLAPTPTPVPTPATAPSGPRQDSALRFDVEVIDAPARTFFQGLADGTPYNMMVDPGISGRVSLTLKHVTIEETLAATRDLYGYDFRRTAAGFLVLPATIQSRLYHLNYLDLQRYGVSKTRVSSGQVSQGDNSQYNSGSTGSSTTSAAATNVDQNGKQIVSLTGTAVMTRVDSDFWTGIEADLKTIVGSHPDHSLIINRQSGIIMVRALPRELRDVDDYLQRTSDSVSRQVVLEARIVEVELNSAYQAGINWASIAKAGGGKLFFGQAAPAGGFDGNLLTPAGKPVTVGPGNPVTSFLQNTLGGPFTIAADFTDFSAFIELLSTQGQTHVLSSPRVSTLQNQKAIIKAGTDEFFVTKVTSNTVTGTATSTSHDVELTPFFSGVALDVTPQIDDDGMVLLHVHPAVSEVTDQVKTLTLTGETDVLPLALSQIRESDSIVKARSGQLIVIGGLMSEKRENQSYSTPLLGDVPLLGKLFRSERKRTTTVELVILLRPLVMTDADWPTLVREPTERISKLQQQRKPK
jgi:MSHA biogenesis protein MshL